MFVRVYFPVCYLLGVQRVRGRKQHDMLCHGKSFFRLFGIVGDLEQYVHCTSIRGSPYTVGPRSFSPSPAYYQFHIFTIAIRFTLILLISNYVPCRNFPCVHYCKCVWARARAVDIVFISYMKNMTLNEKLLGTPNVSIIID